ncbi:MAG: sensor histidine kinase, partial [Planctomycetota bacterium]
FAIWTELAGAQKSLLDLTSDDALFESVSDRPLNQMIRELSFPLDGTGAVREIVVRTALEDRVQLVENAWEDHRVTPEFRERYGAREFVSVPLRAKGRVVGVLLADNAFSRRKITAQQVGILELFAAGAGLAVDNALTYDELKRSLERLQEAQEALIQSERLATVGRLAAHIAHEIRNPLVTIGGHARSILGNLENQTETQVSAEIIYEEVLRLELILRGVMDFSRPVQHEPAEHVLNDIVEGVVDTMDLELRERGIAVRLELEEDLPPCQLDPRRIRQVLTNLLRNGAESFGAAAGREAEEMRIEVSTYRSERAVHLEVTDTGPGVPEDLVDEIFEPFVSRKEGGTGLGLATVRMIMLDHGGEVRLQSLPGEGASFTISLPLEAVSPPHLEVAAENGWDVEGEARSR